MGLFFMDRSELREVINDEINKELAFREKQLAFRKDQEDKKNLFGENPPKVVTFRVVNDGKTVHVNSYEKCKPTHGFLFYPMYELSEEFKTREEALKWVYNNAKKIKEAGFELGVEIRTYMLKESLKKK